MDMKRFFLYVIAIAALALAGCGGNGGGGTTAMMPGDGDGDGTTTPTPMPMCPAGETMGADGTCMPTSVDPPASACTLGGGALECSAKVVAAPIADGNGETK